MSVYYSSFLTLSENDLEAYVKTLFDQQNSGVNRRNLVAYLQQTHAKDRDLVKQQQAKLGKARSLIDRYSADHSFDFSKLPLFTTESFVFATQCTVTNNDIYLTSDQGDVDITGNNIHLMGMTNKGSAVLDTLLPERTVGCLRISANDVLIRGLNINTTNKESIKFPSTTQNLTILDCVFDGANNAESVFWFGENFKGDILIENSIIKNYKDWMLMDANTHSTTPLAGSELGHVVIKDCLFKDCAGSIAIRGVEASPTQSVEVTGCKFEYGTQHQYFWSAVEVNNCIRTTFTGNTASGSRIVANERGVLQCWSKADVSWTCKFSGNTCSGFDFLVQIAANNQFYSPDQNDDRLVLESEAGKVTNVLYGLAKFYPWANGAWDPLNQDEYNNPPSTSWADGLVNK